MNTYLWIALGVYLVSCIPMAVAGLVVEREIKNTLMVADAFATIVAYVFLWAAFDSTLHSLAAVATALAVNSSLGALIRKAGYDPYDYSARKIERETRAAR
jgi:hypothetical protein